mgnify:FL=1
MGGQPVRLQHLTEDLLQLAEAHYLKWVHPVGIQRAEGLAKTLLAPNASGLLVAGVRECGLRGLGPTLHVGGVGNDQVALGLGQQVPRHRAGHGYHIDAGERWAHLLAVPVAAADLADRPAQSVKLSNGSVSLQQPGMSELGGFTVSLGEPVVCSELTPGVEGAEEVPPRAVLGLRDVQGEGVLDRVADVDLLEPVGDVAGFGKGDLVVGLRRSERALATGPVDVGVGDVVVLWGGPGAGLDALGLGVGRHPVTAKGGLELISIDYNRSFSLGFIHCKLYLRYYT